MMKLHRQTKLFLTFTLMLTFTSTLALSTSHAAGEITQDGLTVTPMFYEVRLKPGQTIDSSFSIINNNKFKMNLTTDIFETKDDKLVENSNIDDWLSLNEASFELSPGESAEVNYTLTIPENIINGDYYPVIILRLENNDEPGKTGAAIEQLAAHQIILGINSEEPQEKNLVISNFKSSKTLFTQNQTEFNISIFNSSTTTYTKPIGYFQVLNSQGEVVYQKVLNENLQILKSSETFDYLENYKFDIFNYKNIGKFKAQLLLKEPNTTNSEFAEVEFFIVPYPFLLFTGVVILIILIIFAFILKRRRARIHLNYKRVYK